MSYQQNWQQPPARSGRGKKVAIGCGIALVGFIVLLGGCAALVAGTGGGGSPGNPVPPGGAPQKVTYVVTGGEAANVTYGANGQVSQQTDPSMPWSAEGDAAGSFGFYSLTAQNGASGGEIRCRIEVGGKVVAENVSSGPHAVVTCSGSS